MLFAFFPFWFVEGVVREMARMEGLEFSSNYADVYIWNIHSYND